MKLFNMVDREEIVGMDKGVMVGETRKVVVDKEMVVGDMVVAD